MDEQPREEEEEGERPEEAHQTADKGLEKGRGVRWSRGAAVVFTYAIHVNAAESL